MPTTAQTARQTKEGLKQLHIRKLILQRIGLDLITCDPKEIRDLRAEARVVDRVFGVINSILQAEIENGGNAAAGNSTDET